MRLQFIKRWSIYRPGQVVPSIPDGMANLLIRRSIACEVKDEKKAQRKSTK